MKTVNRVLLVVALLGASMLGGFLANLFGSGRAQAAALASFGPSVKITLIDVLNASIDLPNTTPVKIADVGAFTVENSASLVEVTHNGRFKVDTMTGAGVYFELRVDDVRGANVQPGQPSGYAIVRTSEAGVYVTNTFSGYWEGLPAGTHTVSIWARTSTGSATGAFINPGGWQSDFVVVKEYLPYGITSLPLITR